MDMNTNPLATLGKDKRLQWFKLHTERQGVEACKAWAPTITLEDLCDTKNLPEVFHEHIKDQLLGNHSKKIRPIRRPSFSLEVLDEIRVGDGLDEYGERKFTTYKKGDVLEGLQTHEALQIYLKFGPFSRLSSCKGKVREVTQKTKAKKAK